MGRLLDSRFGRPSERLRTLPPELQEVRDVERMAKVRGVEVSDLVREWVLKLGSLRG
jgi:hypothetical protein